jgi:hypothetical protein
MRGLSYGASRGVGMGIAGGAALLACFAGGLCVQLAQAAEAHPDFSGHGDLGWIVVDNKFISPPTGPGPIVDDPAYPHTRNNFRIGDLSNPILKPQTRETMRRDNEEVNNGKIAYTPRSSCMPAGVPSFSLFVVEPVYFVQGEKEVLITYSGDQQVRHLYMDVPHTPNPKPSWYGESVGHYEGDTLVVDTIGQTDRTFVDNYRTPHSEKLHVVERYHLTDGGRFLQVDIQVDDPDAFTMPWTAIQRYRRAERRPMLEQVCAESNQILFDYHIPQAASPDF